MEYKIGNGVPYEIEVVSLAHGDEVALELTSFYAAASARSCPMSGGRGR